MIAIRRNLKDITSSTLQYAGSNPETIPYCLQDILPEKALELITHMGD
jgi:hypothetical protein